MYMYITAERNIPQFMGHNVKIICILANRGGGGGGGAGWPFNNQTIQSIYKIWKQSVQNVLSYRVDVR